MKELIKKQVGDWYSLLESLVETKGFEKVMQEISKIRSSGTIVYPNEANMFEAFNLCTYNKLQVVILGQDPYHDGSATGLAFANYISNKKISPSLTNIFIAVEMDYGLDSIDFNTNLESWAKQGVLLLNTALTVEKGNPGSHSAMWKPFTERFIEKLSTERDNLVFLLWGKHAQKYEKYIKGNNKIFKAAHPAAEIYSGGSSGFYSCRHFSSANSCIKTPIDWFKNDDAEEYFIHKEGEELPF